MSHNVPPPQRLGPESEWPAAPDAGPDDAPVSDRPTVPENLHAAEPPVEFRSDPPPISSQTFPVAVTARRPMDIGDRILAVVEILFACGFLSNAAAFAFIAALFEVKPDENLVRNPELMFYFLLADTVFLLLIIYFFLRLHNQSFWHLGLRPRALATNVGLGLFSVVGLLVLTGVASLVFKYFFPEYYMKTNPMLEGIKTSRDLGFFMASGILAGGVREEIQRAFVLTRFRKYLFGAWFGLIVWSVFFGSMHYSTQGLQGAVITGLIGFCLGFLFLWRRSLYGPIVGHAAFNTIQLIWFWSATRS